jgi:SAM-dependent methyltransferase
MDLQDFWQKKLQKYSLEEWSKGPNIFASQVIKYFPPVGRLLDLGAGIGQDSLYFKEKGYQVTAADFSKFGLDKIQGIKTELCDLSKTLPFPQNSFDVVYSHLALHYFDTKRTYELFDEIFAILKPGGIFATLLNTLSDPEASHSRTLIGEDFYLTPAGIQKHLFSADSLKKYVINFETLFLDEHGETYKDSIKTLIRFVGRKPLTSAPKLVPDQ